MATKAADYSSIVSKLLEKTKASKVEWKEWGTAFQADLGEGFSFDIHQSVSRSDTTYTLVMRDSQSHVIFDLNLTDDPEIITHRLQLYETLSELYDLARRRALKIDEKVERVSEILEKI
jgi:hypothetical protein